MVKLENGFMTSVVRGPKYDVKYFCKGLNGCRRNCHNVTELIGHMVRCMFFVFCNSVEASVRHTLCKSNVTIILFVFYKELHHSTGPKSPAIHLSAHL